MAKHYAWSDIHNGGTVEHVKLPNGGTKQVVTKRNITVRGTEVTKAKLDVSDEDWDALIDGGSVRPYPLPEGANDDVSPSNAVLHKLTQGSGEIDQNMLLELALTHPPSVYENPSSDKEAKLPVGA